MKSMSNVAQDVGQDLHLYIIDCLNKNNKITKKEIAKATNVSEKTIEREMKNMRNIKYVGHGYSGHWEIKD